MYIIYPIKHELKMEWKFPKKKYSVKMFTYNKKITELKVYILRSF